MEEYFPIVVQVIPLDNFHVQVFFDDGKIVEYVEVTMVDKIIDVPMSLKEVNIGLLVNRIIELGLYK